MSFHQGDLVKNSISIDEEGVTLKELKEINSKLKDDNIRVMLTVNLDKVAKKSCINNMDVIQHITDVRDLVITNRTYKEKRLDHLNELSLIDNLEVFHIYGCCFKPTISFEPLTKFSNLKDLDIDDIRLNTKQQKVLSSFQNLERLRVTKLDLEFVNENKNLKSLLIHRVLINENLLHKKFPNIETISLIDCRKVTDFSFLNKLSNLKNITFGHLSKLESFPLFDRSNKIETIHFFGNNHLKNIDNLLMCENLAELRVSTETLLLEAEAFEKLEKLKKLKFCQVIYYCRNSEKYDEKFDEIALKNGWVTR